LHFLDGEGFLLDPVGQRLYRLNDSATLVWSLVKEGRSKGEICELLVVEYGVAAEEAPRFLDDILHQWSAMSADPVPDAVEPKLVPSFDAGSASADTCRYRLHDTVVSIHYPNPLLFEAIHPLLKPMTTTADAALHITIEPSPAGLKLVSQIDTVATEETVAVAVRAAVTRLAVERSGGLCIVHAGALVAEGRALLLPGNAGRGKSTLSAGLAAAGFEMLSDDSTLLVGQPLQVAPLPTGLCVKPGAYKVLDPLFPRLSALPEWRRPDGLRAKYLEPGLDLPWAADAAPAQWLVFPHYDPSHGTNLRPLTRPQALERLLPGVYFLSGTLNAANLDALIGWIKGIECFELSLSSLNEAVGVLRDLCR